LDNFVALALLPASSLFIGITRWAERSTSEHNRSRLLRLRQMQFSWAAVYKCASRECGLHY